MTGWGDFLVAFSLAEHFAQGMLWFAAALVLSMVTALVGAWVLLVESLR